MLPEKHFNFFQTPQRKWLKLKMTNTNTVNCYSFPFPGFLDIVLEKNDAVPSTGFFPLCVLGRALHSSQWHGEEGKAKLGGGGRSRRVPASLTPQLGPAPPHPLVPKASGTMIKRRTEARSRKQRKVEKKDHSFSVGCCSDFFPKTVV